MNPAFLDAMSWEMAEVYGAVTDQILINLSRYFHYYAPGGKLPRTAFEYQAAMLAQMGKVNADTIRIIKNGLQGADKALSSTLEQAVIDSVGKCEPELLKGVKKGILAPQGVPIVAPNQYRAFNLYYQQAADKLNLVNTVMLESTKSAYKQAVSDVVTEIEIADRINRTAQAVDVAAGEVVTGVSSWNEALRHAAARMREGGLTGFIDHAGRRWSAEAYVAMDVRTTAMNTGRAAIWETNQNFGNDLYLVSYHNGARPGCYPWQNKVISALDNARDTVDLDGNAVHVYAQNETTYGQPAGLFGINCKHYPQPFIPGVSAIRGQPQSPDENEKTYAESQEQRRLERTLREQKREVLAAKAQGASDEEIKYLQGKARETSQQIDDFCESTGRARHRDREAVYTQRQFPSKEKYDVSLFEKQQQETIRQYFSGGGSQTGFTFGQMVTNAPLVAKPPKPTPPPATPPATPPKVTPEAKPATPQATAPQLSVAGYDETVFDGIKGVDDNFKKGLSKALLQSGNETAVKFYGKVADELVVYDTNPAKGAHFSSGRGGVGMNLVAAAKGTGADEPFEMAFHEFGHMADYIFGGRDIFDYLSNTPLNGKRLQEVIKEDYTAFKKAIGAKNIDDLIIKLKDENMSKAARGNISDVLEYCTGRSYPLSIGHGAKYHKREGATEKEFFTEVISSAVTNPEGYTQMQRLFPNAVNMVWELVKGAIK